MWMTLPSSTIEYDINNYQIMDNYCLKILNNGKYRFTIALTENSGLTGFYMMTSSLQNSGYTIKHVGTSMGGVNQTGVLDYEFNVQVGVNNFIIF